MFFYKTFHAAATLYLYKHKRNEFDKMTNSFLLSNSVYSLTDAVNTLLFLQNKPIMQLS